MIFLRTPNLIFLKSKKTAGTSVEVALSCNAGPDDIVTPLALPDEVIRLQTGGRPATNWAYDPAYEARFNQIAVEALANHRAGEPFEVRKISKRKARFFNHMTPDLIVERLGRETFEAALKVTICRHPYEQIVSRAYWRLALAGREPTEASVRQTIDALLDLPAANEPYVWFEGRPVADVVLRYEHLNDDLAELEARAGLALVANLPRTKHRSRIDRRPAADILTKTQKQRCRDTHRREFDLFGFTP